MTTTEIRISYSAENSFRYIESGSGSTYRCYGIALNDKAAKKMLNEVRRELMNVSKKCI